MANDRQISQLVLQVDANIAVAQRELQQLARVVRQQTGDINNSLATTEVAHVRMGRAFGQARIAQMELSHVVTASVDAYAAGFSPLRIMTLEMGRLAEAATFLGGGGGGVLGKFAGFMSGPWGIAVLLGVSVLSQLFAKMGQGEDSVSALVDKMRKQAAQAAASKIADQEWAASIDGLIDRNVKLIDTLQKRLKAEEDLDAQSLRAAQQDKTIGENDLRDAKTRQANLQQQLAVAQRDPNLGTNVGGPAEARIKQLQADIEKAKRDVTDAQTGIAEAQAAIVKSTIVTGEAQGKAAVDASAAIDLWSKKYTAFLHGIEQSRPELTKTVSAGFYAVQKALQDAASAKVDINAGAHQAALLGQELKAGKLTAVAYAEAMKKVAAALEAAAEAAKDAKKGAGEFGKQISFADAKSIAEGAGLTVTSGYRSTKHQAELYNDPTVRRPGNPVAKPGTSAHEGVNGKWALDIAFADGLTAEKLKKLYGNQGVTLSAVYKEKGHFHIEGSRSQAAAAEKAQQAGVVRGDHQQSAFDQASDRLDQELLQAQAQLGGYFQTRAGIAARQVDADTKRLQDSIADQLQLGKDTHFQQGITEAQANILQSKVQQISDEKKIAIGLQGYNEWLDQRQQAADQQFQFQTDDLKFADDIAQTQGEHRALQLQILDIVYKQREADLRTLLAKQKAAALAGDLVAAQQALLTQQQINQLPTEKAQDQRRTQLGTSNPLEAWERQVPHTAAQINEALQSIEVQGIDNLANSITDVITGTKSLGAAFKDISRQIITEIIQMTVKMLIFKAISAAAGAFGGGGGGLPIPGLGGSEPTSLGGLPDFLPGGDVGAGLPGFASGGSMMIGGSGGIDSNMLSLNGSPVARVTRGETLAILPKTPRIGIPRAANANGPTEVVVHVAASEDFNVRVANISASHVQAAAPVIIRAARDSTVRSLTRPRLVGGN